MAWWVMMPVLCLFVIAHGYLVRWIAGSIVSKEKKDVAAFSFVLGMAYIAYGPISDLDGLQKLSAGLGYVFGVGAVWYLFFKQPKASS